MRHVGVRREDVERGDDEPLAVPRGERTRGLLAELAPELEVMGGADVVAAVGRAP
jgi:hypothetical protein